MRRSLNCADIPGLTATQWKRVQPLLREKTLTPEQLQAAGRFTYVHATSVLFALYFAKLAQLHWLVYHCKATIPVAKRSYRRGFQPTPWRCPRCKREAEADDLKYEIQASIPKPVSLRGVGKIP